MKYNLREELKANIQPGNEEVIESIYEFLSPVVKTRGISYYEKSMTYLGKYCLQYVVEDSYDFVCHYADNKMIEINFWRGDNRVNVHINDKGIFMETVSYRLDDESQFKPGYHLLELNTKDGNIFEGNYYYYDEETNEYVRAQTRKRFADSFFEHSDFSKLGFLPDEENHVSFTPEGENLAQKLYAIDSQLSDIFIKEVQKNRG